MKEIIFPCIKMEQPIGEFFIASITHKDLLEITYTDQRKIIEEESDIDTYLGIQRPLNEKRVKEIKEYVKTIDACFPTGIIVAVDGRNVEFNSQNNTMKLCEYKPDGRLSEDNIEFENIAKILDGQHRIAGLKDFPKNEKFNINVTIFVDIDPSEQAQIFSTVNLAQTKVNKSLVYDLYELAKYKSPQKSCHNIAVTLNQIEGSPFYHKIKRLGVATEGRFNETITQSTFVRSFIKYICKNETEEVRDRDLYMKGKIPERATENEQEKLIFRNMFIDDREMDITDIIWEYFDAVKERWNEAWNNSEKGSMLSRSNGFMAHARFLRDAYNLIKKEIPNKSDFLKVLNEIDINDSELTTDIYKPGAEGERKLYNDLQNKICHKRT
ncbi:DGQHR domain-containing protein [Aliarcobacter butzleri]|uniref:DGQHR domain-containing protein n=1 Tax=Aliarcobacter butzleri TaxID=28197 RepID=UPI001EDB2F95|nr:DGQHR domain-containing protein [Aliarcobacter butzleri]MCG3662651.1 DGQHR domain-containing protein [Aliarcobacter butzleri]